MLLRIWTIQIKCNMKKVICLLYVCFAQLSMFAQSVYMHEAQEDDSLNDVGFEYLLLFISVVMIGVPILLFILLGISTIKEKIEEFFSPSKEIPKSKAQDYICLEKKTTDKSKNLETLPKQNVEPVETKVWDYDAYESCEAEDILECKTPLNCQVDAKDLSNALVDEHGVLYSRDKKKLLKLLDLTLSEYTVKEGTKVICNHAFENSQIKAVKLPNSLCIIGMMSFGECCCLTSI